MASVFLFVFFLLSHLPLLQSTEEEMRNVERCPPFSCGELQRIPFPFASTSHPECGPFTVECPDDFIPWIRFGDREKRYQILDIFLNDTIRVLDHDLWRHLKSGRCESVTNITLPRVSFSSFEIVPSHNQSLLLKCDSTISDSTTPSDFKSLRCDHSNTRIFYGTSSKNITDAFPRCSILQLPWSLGPDPRGPPDPVTPYIDLKVNVTHECYECHEEGGQCRARDNVKFYCKKGLSKKQKIGICVGSSVGVLCLALIIYWGKSRGVFSKMPAKRTQSAASARSDVEAGSVYFGVPVYSYSELEEATNNFDVERELGDGGFGTVYYGKLRDGREVAIKRLYEHNSKRVAQFMNEVEILTRLRHMNLVSLYGCTSRRSRELLLVYEYIPNGTVADHIHGDRATPGSPPWPTRMSIAIETATALAYLHASEIIHRDVKTNNILLDHNFCVKVADFGISRLFPFNVTHVSTAPQGTPGYVDPEYYQCYQLSTKSDVYSFGIVLVELISSLPAVDLARHQHDINLASLALKRIERSEYQELIDSHIGFEWDKEVQRMTISVAQLAFRCIQHDKELRPSMDEVLEVLKQIQRGNEAPDDGGKAFDNDGIMNIKPPTSQDSR